MAASPALKTQPKDLHKHSFRQQRSSRDQHRTPQAAAANIVSSPSEGIRYAGRWHGSHSLADSRRLTNPQHQDPKSRRAS